jgi:hypothetical protein
MTEQELNKEFEAYAHRMGWLIYDNQRLQSNGDKEISKDAEV